MNCLYSACRLTLIPGGLSVNLTLGLLHVCPSSDQNPSRKVQTKISSPNSRYDLWESNKRVRKRRVHEASQHWCICGFGPSEHVVGGPPSGEGPEGAGNR